MTEEQILTLASKYLELHPIHGDESVWDEWSGKPEDLLKFARAIRAQSFYDGYNLAVMDRFMEEQRKK
jgi:hypothetical protein